MSAQRRDEAERILRLYNGDAGRAFEAVERQLATLVVRTQVLLSLSGIVVTVTGFSGRAIAQTGRLAQGCITAGILVVLASAAVAIAGVLRLRWATQAGGDGPADMIERALALRDRKTGSLGWALGLFVAGFSLYCVAIAQLLMAP